MSAASGAAFLGAKVMLFLGRRLLLVRRDPRPDIVWPGRLDFPGGGREGGESAEACAIRETREEVGLVLAREDLAWKALRAEGTRRHWFFAAHLGEGHAGQVRLGAEGTGWTLMTPDELLAREDAIPPFQAMVQRYLRERVTGSPR